MAKQAEEKTEKREPYVLLTGSHYELDEDGQQVERQAGDIIKLTAKQAIQFADKVQSKEEYQLTQERQKKRAAALKAIEEEEAEEHAARQQELREELEEEEEEGNTDAAKKAQAKEVTNAKPGEPVSKNTGATAASNPSMNAKK